MPSRNLILPAVPAVSKPHTGSAADRPANTYLPVYMPEMTISITATGGLVTGWVASVNKCLAYESVGGLIAALQDDGYPYVETFDYVPFPPAQGTSFAGGPREGLVPWLGISPVPPLNGIWDSQAGAFVVAAGVYGYFWRHSNVIPFVGSSYENDLRNDIFMRIESAKNGMPAI